MDSTSNASQHPQFGKVPMIDPEDANEIIKEGAIEGARRGADQDWLLTAMRGVRVIARRKQYFTADDVWAWLRPLEVKTHDNRAMGAVLQSSRRDLVIEPTNEWRISERSVCHRRPLRVWKSLRYESI